MTKQDPLTKLRHRQKVFSQSYEVAIQIGSKSWHSLGHLGLLVAQELWLWAPNLHCTQSGLPLSLYQDHLLCLTGSKILHLTSARQFQ